MPATPPTVTTMLPFTAPAERPPRLLLYAMRRMGAHGLRDAHAANAMLGSFGQSYRRPLVLLRVLLTELARASQTKVTIAACCCARMTRDEAMLIEAVALANVDPQAAHEMIANVLGNADCVGALTTAQALAQAFADLGRPLP